MNFKKHYLNLKKYIFNKFILNGKFILCDNNKLKFVKFFFYYLHKLY